MSDAGADYFANHANKLRFPWSLYHRPLVERFAREIAASAGSRVLNVGSGPFSELPYLPSGREYNACDVDPQAIAAVRARHPEVPATLAHPDQPLPLADGAFDVVMASEVIEHVIDAGPWLDDLLRVLKPGGRLLLTTPNYGISTLPLIEYTVLELLAWRQGFTRRGIHPNKLTRRRFSKLLESRGVRDVRIDTISFGWVLFASCTKR
jgi:SAM-dependent methyltransferase